MAKKIYNLIIAINDRFNRYMPFSLSNHSLIILLALILSALMTFHFDYVPQEIIVGAIAPKDVKADRNYEIVDEKTTEKFRVEAERSVRPVYDYDVSVGLEISRAINASFEEARLFLVENLALETNRSLPEELENQLKKRFHEQLNSTLTDEQYTTIRKYRFHPNLARLLVTIISEPLSRPIVYDKAELVPQIDKGLVLRTVGTPKPFMEETVSDLETIQELKEVQSRLANVKVGVFEKNTDLSFVVREDFRDFKELGIHLLKSNTNYDSSETYARQQKARASVKDNMIKIKRGESIVRSGDRYEPLHLTLLNGIKNTRKGTNEYLKLLGIFLFINIVLLVVYSYSRKYIRKFKPTRKDLVFLGITLIFFIGLLRISAFLAISIKESLPFLLGSSTLYYCIPIAAGAMLVRFILNSETALIFAIILSLFSGIFLENNLELAVYYLLSGVYAAHAIAHVDRRSLILLSGFYTGLISALTIFSLNILSLVTLSQEVNLYQISLNMVSGFFGGLFTAMMILGLIPVVEVLFNYTTDIKLLELANMSHPLLKEMIVCAPGTYHHSQLVGILSEAAAQAIGANPLLARVASYYHDIGKMRKPHYFIENQRGFNPHDTINPAMSAYLIKQHISDGIEMAGETKLPQKIADMIPQHQGTKLVGYFYDKAKRNADAAGVKLDEKEYRYPGPKPQNREAGIIMLADTVEAAVRALPDKTNEKIQSTVETMVNYHFVDEQLDECDLTLRDLHRIALAFIKVLNGIYHRRVEYPEGALLATQEGTNHATVSQHRPAIASNITQLFRKKDS